MLATVKSQITESWNGWVGRTLQLPGPAMVGLPRAPSVALSTSRAGAPTHHRAAVPAPQHPLFKELSPHIQNFPLTSRSGWAENHRIRLKAKLIGYESGYWFLLLKAVPLQEVLTATLNLLHQFSSIISRENWPGRGCLLEGSRLK